MPLKTHLLILFLLTTAAVRLNAEVIQEPLRTMSSCLIMHNWSSWGLWRFQVYAMAGKQVLIGEPNNYLKIVDDQPGYSHVVNGEVVHYYADAISIDDIATQCDESCPENYVKRVNWFQRRGRDYMP